MIEVPESPNGIFYEDLGTGSFTRATRPEIVEAYEEQKSAHLALWEAEERDEVNKVEIQRCHKRLSMARDVIHSLKQ